MVGIVEGNEPDALSPEALGEVGETLFQNLCALARLSCNKSDRDRSGWDFIVDFPLSDATAPETLDQRQKTTCHVQLKTTAVIGNGTVSLKLSAADLLAKDAHPALIVIFRLGKHGKPLKGYLVHLLNEPLHKLLRRLRHAEAQGRRDTHNLKISFDYRRYGKSFELAPASLKAALAEACGPNPAVYSMEKVRQLNELGYEEGQFAAKAIFQVNDERHLSRLLLGMEPIKPIELRAFDVRFGIAVPYEGPVFNAMEEIFLSPPSVRECFASISGPPLTPAASFDAQMVLAAPIDGKLRMLIKSAYFQFVFQETKDQIEVACTFETVKSPLSDLADMLRALNYLSSREGSISVSSKDGGWGPLQIPLRDGTGLEGPSLDALPRLASFIADWKMLLDIAGVPSSALISWDDLWNDGAHLATDLMLSDTPIARFKFDIEELPANGESIKAIYLNAASVAGESILYAVEITLAPEPGNASVYCSVAFRPIEARAATIELDDYMDDLVDRFHPPVVLHPDNIQRVSRAQMD